MEDEEQIESSNAPLWWTLIVLASLVGTFFAGEKWQAHKDADYVNVGRWAGETLGTMKNVSKYNELLGYEGLVNYKQTYEVQNSDDGIAYLELHFLKPSKIKDDTPNSTQQDNLNAPKQASKEADKWAKTKSTKKSTKNSTKPLKKHTKHKTATK